MGLFDELDVANAADNPFEIPNNTYEAVVSKVDVKKNSKGNMGMTLTYTIQGGTEFDGIQVTDYFRIPHADDADQLDEAGRKRSLSYLKRRLASLDVPESQMNSVSADDLIGLTCYITTKMNGDYINVTNLTTSLSGDGDGGSTDPFA